MTKCNKIVLLIIISKCIIIAQSFYDLLDGSFILIPISSSAIFSTIQHNIYRIMLKNGWLLQKGICILQRNSRLMQKKNLHRHKVSKFIIGFAPHHRALKFEKKCANFVSMLPKAMFFGVLLNSASDPLSFSKQIMTLYTIFYLCHFFHF